MRLTIGARLGDGGFADIYEAVDELHRPLAVKIIRPSAAGYSGALEHAQALARAQHPNIVSVVALERVTDPVSGGEVDAVVMERLDGATLGERLGGSAFTTSEAERIAAGLISGLRHIHGQGMTHGDLHADNVMLTSRGPKIIDLLYRDSLALRSTATRETLLRRDILNLRLLLHDVLLNSERDAADAADFNASLGGAPSLDDVERAFSASTTERRINVSEQVDRVMQRVNDEGFVDTELYAKALAAETPEAATLPLLLRMLDERTVRAEHLAFVRLLWGKLVREDKATFTGALASALDAETPKGKWGPPIQMLRAIGKEGWDMLPRVSRLRLEGAIVNNILAGHHDIYGTNVGTPGALGTYANTFWAYFEDRERLIENIVARLRVGWYGQNYVGKYLMNLMPLLADTDARRSRLIAALIGARKNDARLIVDGLSRLPLDWQQEIQDAE